MADIDNGEDSLEAHVVRIKEKRPRKPSFLDQLDNVQKAVLAAVALLTLGGSAAALLHRKADQADLEKIRDAQGQLQQHFVEYNVRQENTEQSMKWQQDTLFRLADRFGVPNVQPTPALKPVPSPTPATHPTPDSVPTH